MIRESQSAVVMALLPIGRLVLYAPASVGASFLSVFNDRAVWKADTQS